MSDHEPPTVDRRGLLTAGAGLVALTAVGGAVAGCEDSTAGVRSSEGLPAGVRSPARDGALVVTGRQVVDGRVEFDSVDVPAGATLEFDPNRSTTLIVTGNVVVHGRLEMRPARPGVVHRLLFDGVDERAYVGGGMDPSESDVGLWVMGQGVLDLRGTRRRGWNRKGRHHTWERRDDVRIAPTRRGDYDTFARFRPGDDLPQVSGPDGRTYRTEAFNLTRNVAIEGRPGGRAHVFIRSSRPQSIRYVLFRHLGPRRPGTSSSDATEPVTGRYPVHFHMCGGGSRGSVVEGCVVRDSSRAFVPHMSHGITMHDCIAFRILDDAFWWDEGAASNDITWQHCAVFDIRHDPEFRGTIAGFMLGLGTRVTIRDCVAVGSHGNGNDSGFQWPSFANQRRDNVWTAERLVAHNNRGDGIFVWQNDGNDHVVEKVTCYRNGDAGIHHGAYRNAYLYRDVVLFDNGTADLKHNALAKDGDRQSRAQRWERLHAPRLLIGEHAAPSSRTVLFLDAHIDEVVVDEFNDAGGSYEIHADLTSRDITIVDQKSTIRVVRPGGGQFLVGNRAPVTPTDRRSPASPR